MHEIEQIFSRWGGGTHQHTILPKLKKKLYKIEKILGRRGDPETSPLNPTIGRGELRNLKSVQM